MNVFVATALSAVAIVACSKKAAAPPTAPAAVAVTGSTSSMSNMPTTPAALAAKTGDSTGVVKAIDTAAGTLTLDHQPIPGVGWPAMTMTFRATPPSLLSGLKPGDKVGFSVRVEGGGNTVTAIRKP